MASPQTCLTSVDLPGEWLTLDAFFGPDLDPDLLTHVPDLILGLLFHYELVWKSGLSVEPGCHPPAFPAPWLGVVGQAVAGDALSCQPKETPSSWPPSLRKSSLLAALLTRAKALM